MIFSVILKYFIDPMGEFGISDTLTWGQEKLGIKQNHGWPHFPFLNQTILNFNLRNTTTLCGPNKTT